MGDDEPEGGRVNERQSKWEQVCMSMGPGSRDVGVGGGGVWWCRLAWSYVGRRTTSAVDSRPLVPILDCEL